MLRKVSFILTVTVLVTIVLSSTILLENGSNLQAVNHEKVSLADEIVNLHIQRLQMIDEGRQVFEELLKKEKGRAPKYGTPEYLKYLLEYAEPGGLLRRSAPDKWKFIDAYASDYYAKHMLLPAPVGDTGNQELSLDAINLSLQSSQYNRGGAQAYTIRYAGYPNDDPVNKHYNPAYYFFPTADCANFVSQVLHEGGGIPQVDVWWRPWWDYNDWYYYKRGTDPFDANGDDTWSWSWVKSHYLYWHIRSRLGVPVSNVDALGIGDAIQMDFDRDGGVDHSMVVTMIDSLGNRYISQHTINRTNHPFSSTLRDHPNAQYHYLCITY